MIKTRIADFIKQNGFIADDSILYDFDKEFKVDSDVIYCPIIKGNSEEKVKNFGSGQKPINLLQRLLAAHPNKNALILDFFAGSGSTLHATMSLNAIDSGRRNCILVTNDEGEFKDAEGNVLQGGICTHVTRPRLAKVIQGYVNSSGKNVAGLGENLVFIETSMYTPKTNERGHYIEYKQFLVEAIDLLRFKEGAIVEQKPYYKGDKGTWDEEAPWGLYSSLDGKKHLVVLLDEYAIENCVEVIKTLTGSCALYPFTYQDDNSAVDMCQSLSNVKVYPVPENLLKTYRRLNRKSE